MESKIIKSLIVLGIPGVALGVFYLLFKNFNFQFDAIPPVLSAVIAIVFLLIVGGVTLFALYNWAPSKKKDTRDHEAIVSTIAEWTRIVYEVKKVWRQAMDKKEPYPGKHKDLVEQENALYTELLGKLDSSRPSEEQLISDIKTFRDVRDADDISTWSTRRDTLMQSVQAALKS